MASFTKSVLFNEESIKSQKECDPGPNVKFSSRKSLPFYEYLINVSKKGSLGCKDYQYPKYKNGKYCCSLTKTPNQDQLDYINNLLEAAMNNVGVTMFKKNTNTIEFIIERREELFKKDSSLIDNLELPDNPDTGLPYLNLKEWFKDNLLNSMRISSHRPDPTGLGLKKKTKKHNKIKANKSRKGRKGNKSRKHRK